MAYLNPVNLIPLHLFVPFQLGLKVHAWYSLEQFFSFILYLHVWNTVSPRQSVKNFNNCLKTWPKVVILKQTNSAYQFKPQYQHRYYLIFSPYISNRYWLIFFKSEDKFSTWYMIIWLIFIISLAHSVWRNYLLIILGAWSIIQRLTTTDHVQLLFNSLFLQFKIHIIFKTQERH